MICLNSCAKKTICCFFPPFGASWRGRRMRKVEEEIEDPLRKDVVRWCNQRNPMWRRWQIQHCHCPQEHPFIWAKDYTFALEHYTCPFLSSKTFWEQKDDCLFLPLNYSFYLTYEPTMSMFSIPSGSCSCSCLKSQGEGLEASLWAFS